MQSRIEELERMLEAIELKAISNEPSILNTESPLEYSDPENDLFTASRQSPEPSLLKMPLPDPHVSLKTPLQPSSEPEEREITPKASSRKKPMAEAVHVPEQDSRTFLLDKENRVMSSEATIEKLRKRLDQLGVRL